MNKAPEPETDNVLRFRRKHALWLFLIAAAGLIFTAFISDKIAAFLPEQPQLRELALNLIYYIPFTLLPVFISIRRRPRSAAAMRPGPVSIGTMLYISVLAVLCVFFVSDISLVWCIPLQKLGFDVFKNQLSLPENPAMLVLSVFTAAAIPGVCEELVFRGVVFSGFEDEGTLRACRFSALLFALLHGSITGFPGQFMLGVILATLVFCADSIYAGMIFHTVYNATVVVLQFMQRDLPPEIACPADIVSAVGGVGGVFLLLVEIMLIGWMLRFSVNVFYMRARQRGVYKKQDWKWKYQPKEKILLIAGLIMVAVLFVSDGLYMLQ